MLHVSSRLFKASKVRCTVAANLKTFSVEALAARPLLPRVPSGSVPLTYPRRGHCHPKSLHAGPSAGDIPASKCISYWRQQVRSLSTTHDGMPAGAHDASKPNSPSELNAEMATGTQDAVALLLKHGLGKRRLDEIVKDAGKETPPLIERWQSMMECFIGTQVHVLAGLGYSPDEHGITLYNQQLAYLMTSLDPDTQEAIRVKGRDTWRCVLSSAFGIPLKEIEENELSIVDARNVMHKVSQKMMEKEVLDYIRKKCDAVEGPEAGSATMTPAEMQMRHTIVQEALIDRVYLGGVPSLVSECGFGEGERAYIFMQLVMSEHQADPLVSQYVSAAMMEILKAAGLDPATLQKIAEEEQKGKST